MGSIVSVYHYTKKENVDSIISMGLHCGTKYHTLGSKLRDNANYFWLSPVHCLMGYKESCEYICLKIAVEVSICFVVNMDLASAAFVNFIMEKKREALHDYRSLIMLHDDYAVNYRLYENGYFRAPEVIIQNKIHPDDMEIIDPFSIEVDKYKDNRKIYNEAIKNRIIALTAEKILIADMDSTLRFLEKNEIIKKVAIHDDSSGMLQSYIVTATNEFFTVDSCI